MGFLEKLFSKNKIVNTIETKKTNVSELKSEQKNDIVYRNENLSTDKFLYIHPDIQNLLWIADGPKKNYVPKTDNVVYEFGGIKIIFSSFSSQEPSLIFMRLPIKEIVDSKEIDRPPYFPTYTGLSEEQRGVFWKFLADPYSGDFDIGYVFILYYGLERHLLEGRYEDAFHVILKLRDVYSNTSFQSYSACALILTCLIRQKPELAREFYESLDKEYEFNFSNNLFLLCKIGLNQNLTPKDIMRMSKSFEFTNQNYIKKYPDLFIEELSDVMRKSFGSDELNINKYVTQTELKKLHKESIPIFANVSIRNESFEIPLVIESFKLKKTVYDLLENTHNNVKEKLAQMRKTGQKIPERTSAIKKEVKPLVFDEKEEMSLLEKYKSDCLNAMNKHFTLIELQNFYYKYRELNEIYLDKCIEYCYEDISSLSQLQEQYRKDEKEKIQQFAFVDTKEKIKEKIENIGFFPGDIPAFKRLAIVYEKQKKYLDAIDICKQAIKYYKEIGLLAKVTEYEERKMKLEAKSK